MTQVSGTGSSPESGPPSRSDLTVWPGFFLPVQSRVNPWPFTPTILVLFSELTHFADDGDKAMPDLKYISLIDAGLEPIDGPALQTVTAGPSKFTANTREKIDRRQNEDRRTELRFQDNRRVSKDRRPVKTWEKGHNL
jgi:hypothetical protein